MTRSDKRPDYPSPPWSDQTGIEEAIVEFKTKLPGWWFTLGECQVSCDASCAPTPQSPDIKRIDNSKLGWSNPGCPFDSGFHVDLPQPSTLAQALRHVMEQALAYRAAN